MSEKLVTKTKLMFNFVGGTSIKIKSPLTREEVEAALREQNVESITFASCDEDREIAEASMFVLRDQLQSVLILEMATVPVKLFNSDGVKS